MAISGNVRNSYGRIYIYIFFLRGTTDEHVTDLYGNIGYVWKYKGMYRNVRDHKEYS